jgi:hypothetical protein
MDIIPLINSHGSSLPVVSTKNQVISHRSLIEIMNKLRLSIQDNEIFELKSQSNYFL